MAGACPGFCSIKQLRVLSLSTQVYKMGTGNILLGATLQSRAIAMLLVYSFCRNRAIQWHLA